MFFLTIFIKYWVGDIFYPGPYSWHFSKYLKLWFNNKTKPSFEDYLPGNFTNHYEIITIGICIYITRMNNNSFWKLHFFLYRFQLFKKSLLLIQKELDFTQKTKRGPLNINNYYLFEIYTVSNEYIKIPWFLLQLFHNIRYFDTLLRLNNSPSALNIPLSVFLSLCS